MPGNLAGGSAGISDDGRFVAFFSDAANLVPDDTNFAQDVFVRDRLTGTTERVNVSTAGAEANDGSSNSAISADGSTVAFVSLASNLVAGDTNACSFFIDGDCLDIFVHGGPAITADVRVAKTATPDPALIGRPLTYAVAAANDGPFPRDRHHRRAADRAWDHLQHG